METELSIETERTLRERLIEEQNVVRPGPNLARQDPERWLDVASGLVRGVSIKHFRDKYSMDYYTIKKIQNSIWPSIEEFRINQANEIDVNLSMMDEAISGKMNKVLEKGDFDLDEAKSMKEMAVATQALGQRSNRLRGEADVKVEHKQVKTPAEYKAELEAMFKENVIEAEIVETEESNG